MHTNETIQISSFTLIRMQPLKLSLVPSALPCHPWLWLKTHVGRPEWRWWCNRGWRNEDLGTFETTVDTRCYIPSEIFKLPDYCWENWLAQQLSKTLNVVDTMVLSDDHPNAPCVASSGRRKWSSRFIGFLRRQLLTNDGYGVNDQLLLACISVFVNA